MENRKIKIMCSSGGRILPRPSDMKLRYVGGETRMLSFPRNTDYEDFFRKMVDIYGPDILFRYQLPDEDLDALVTVSSDEDLENMIEECDRLNSKSGSSKLRVFVFSISELDLADLQNIPDHKTSEQKFVDAINDASADIHSALHMHFRATEPSTCTEDVDGSFEAWHRNQMQGKASSTMKNGSSEFLQGETLENFYNSANHVKHVHSHISFPTQPALFNSMAYNNTFNNNFHNVAIGVIDIHEFEDRGLASTQQELINDLSANTQVSRSPSHLQKKSLVDYEDEIGKEKDEDKTYRREDRFVMDPSVIAGPPNESENFDKFFFNGNLIQSDSKLHGNHFSLDAGAFIQKQLQNDHHQLEDDSEKTVDGQYVAAVGSFKQDSQKKVFQKQQGDCDWDSFPLYDSSPASDLAFAESNQWDPGSLQQKLNDEALSRQKIGLECTSIARETVDDSVNEASNPMGRRQMDMYLPEMSGGTVFDSQTHEKMVSVPWIAPDPSSSTVSSSDDCKKKMQNQINYQLWSRANDKHADDISGYLTPVCYGDDNKHHLQPSSTLYVQREQQKMNAVDKEVKCTNTNEGFTSSLMDYYPTNDMFSDLLCSSQVVDCPPAQSSPDGNIGSKLTYLVEAHSSNNIDELESIAIDPTLSDKRTFDDPGLRMIRDVLPSKEEIDMIMSATFSASLNKETCKEDEFPRAGDPVVFDTVGDQALSSLIDSWEASLLRDEHGPADDAQHQIHGNPLEANNLNADIKKNDSREDSGIEFEGNDEFKSVGYGTVDPVAVAEAEAIARGLQIIRNIDLEELRELGSGTFGTVYHGKWRGTDVAIKRIKASCFTGREAERNRLIVDFWREAYILGQLHHPNVVAFYGIVPDGPGATLATVTEYMVNGSVKQVLQSKDRTLDHRKRLFIAMDAAFGMEYLHSKNVVHFDIKCENLLVNLKDIHRPICKIADLGLSKVKQQTFVSGGVRGTLPWMAPELLNGNSNLVSEKVDVFSFGIVMWELLTGEEPYADMHYGAIIGGIVNNTLRPRVPRWCDSEWKSLMERCWAADPVDRPPFSEIARRLRTMEASTNLKAHGQGILKQ